MATRFVRVDLSDQARDYRPLAIEPGVPMLDASAANSKILFRWIGELAAEPVWEGDSVNFYVCDHGGGRLVEVICQPAGQHELRSLLPDELALLKDRLEKARPETPMEQAFHKALLRTFNDLVNASRRAGLDSYFFRYRDVENRWRLVWCWGYQRIEEKPAPAVVCADPNCALLFLRRPGKSPKCPACFSTLQVRPVREGRRRRGLLLALLLLLLAAGLLGWFFRPDRLVAVPNALTGPVGSRVDLKLLEAGLFSKVDVTGHAVGVVLDPAVAHFDQMTGVVRLVSPGRTVIRFQMGNLKTAVALEAVAAANPEKITIEPHRVELGVGTTAHLKLVGHYKDGSKADLTAAAEWKLHSDQVVCARGGLLEGLAPGAATISARYRANPDSPCLEATANVSVSRIDATSLEIAVEPLPVGVGRGSRLQIDAVAADGKRYSLLESSQLKTAVGPSSLASVHGSILRGDQAGQGLLSATFATGLKAQQDFAVVAIPGLDQLEVHPNKLNLVVGEITDLSSKRPFWWRERGIAPGHGFQGDRLHAEITAAEETAVEWSLDWLTRHQLPDGSWSLKGYTHRCTDATCSGPGIIDADSAATAMGLLPFLAHGETGKRAQVVSSGLAWLVRHQKPDGDLSAGTERQMYAHALATMALCEAFGMTGDQRVGAAAQAAVDFIAAAQNRQTGGWRYHPGEEGDTSVMGWQIMALKSAQLAGLKVANPTMESAGKFLGSVAQGPHGGQFAYSPGQPPTPAMTAVGLLCRQDLGAKRDDPLMTDGVNYLLANLPDAASRNLYYWYYATMVMHNMGDHPWEVWNGKMRWQLVETQNVDPNHCARGSWDPNGPTADPWGGHGGRHMITSLSVLTLEVYYRYLPLYSRDGPSALPGTATGTK